MIITVGGIKGGSGKTTVTTNLAVIRASDGRDVLLIDADDQETASDSGVLRDERAEGVARYYEHQAYWRRRADANAAAPGQVPGYRDLHGGRDTSSQRAALSVADVLLAPFVPRSFDIWTLERIGL